MANQNNSATLLSPAELSYLHSSLCLDPPVRPDLRTPTEFRRLIAETDILPSTNGSARVCFSDGTEAIVGVKAEVEKSLTRDTVLNQASVLLPGGSKDPDFSDSHSEYSITAGQRSSTFVQHGGLSPVPWLEISLDIPGFRDDDSLPVFLSAMLTEALVSGGSLRDKLQINERWHWKLYIDILLLSAPLSYPLPLLSLTTHLALLDTALPRLTSEPSDDPLFDDDWAAAIPLYQRSDAAPRYDVERPPITLLVMSIGNNIIFDPSKDELAVAESVLAISIAAATPGGGLKLLGVRFIDPPSRLTPLGVPDSMNPATTQSTDLITSAGQLSVASHDTLLDVQKGTVWSPPRGGMKRAVLTSILKMVLEPGGPGQEVLDGLASLIVLKA